MQSLDPSATHPKLLTHALWAYLQLFYEVTKQLEWVGFSHALPLVTYLRKVQAGVQAELEDKHDVGKSQESLDPMVNLLILTQGELLYLHL